MDAAPPPVPEEPPARDWLLLPLDALSSVFVRVGAVDILMGAGLVCRSWLEAAKLPDVWRTVDMENHKVVREKDEDVLRAMAKAATDRSGGQLRVFSGKDFVTEELIIYIVKRSPSLTALRLVSCDCDVFCKRLASVVKESPMLELRSLELDDTELNLGELKAVLENCPLLEILRVRNCFEIYDDDDDDDDVEAGLRANFPWIKTLTLQCDDDFRYFSESDYYCDYYGRDSEDEWTDWSL